MRRLSLGSRRSGGRDPERPESGTPAGHCRISSPRGRRRGKEVKQQGPPKGCTEENQIKDPVTGDVIVRPAWSRFYELRNGVVVERANISPRRRVDDGLLEPFKGLEVAPRRAAPCRAEPPDLQDRCADEKRRRAPMDPVVPAPKRTCSIDEAKPCLGVAEVRRRRTSWLPRRLEEAARRAVAAVGQLVEPAKQPMLFAKPRLADELRAPMTPTQRVASSCDGQAPSTPSFENVRRRRSSWLPRQLALLGATEADDASPKATGGAETARASPEQRGKKRSAMHSEEGQRLKAAVTRP